MQGHSEKWMISASGDDGHGKADNNYGNYSVVIEGSTKVFAEQIGAILGRNHNG